MWPCGWSEEGRQVLAMLRAAVFPNAWPGATLMDLVLNTTLQQVNNSNKPRHIFYAFSLHNQKTAESRAESSYVRR